MELYDELHAMIQSDPERAWPLVLAFVRDHPESADADLIEDFIYEHGDRFIDRIEAAAHEDPVVYHLVDQAHVGGFASKGAAQFHRLQDRLREASVPDEPFLS